MVSSTSQPPQIVRACLVGSFLALCVVVLLPVVVPAFGGFHWAWIVFHLPCWLFTAWLTDGLTNRVQQPLVSGVTAFLFGLYFHVAVPYGIVFVGALSQL
ncbi:MAG TPA: hypothetical protein VGD58_15400 [Herpetosiphonaceae bacterium]